ncbi:protein export cytoplasm protein SecA ATPase RNA helicase [Gracilibacillus boraciitolerans JCM 21714]|uniref:Protein export cytoplasm protein SecA ATPase RNA helicase n=1 Tax=Gracilibacillus boraciitolerans JCM 21714 TaxID=1298598 RepID=W4VN96_9BACI|nr:GNAT family N-acetyltransferase [Gracilibacillus boraciitolerans]GAE94667.1 protein export cytoplasm protein SecA ATPase RNA helicase [Gracilibacillus boraciitolerans JCM 21714]
MNDILYKDDCTIIPIDLANIFEKSGIKRPYDDLDRLQQMLDHANILLTAWDEEKLIRVARGLTDFSYCCYLSDLAVDQSYQKQGIGKLLIQRVQQLLNENVALILLSSPTAIDYYPKIGFDKIDNGYKIPRQK